MMFPPAATWTRAVGLRGLGVIVLEVVLGVLGISKRVEGAAAE